MTDRYSRPELRALTGLRGVAAAIVALAHFGVPLPYDLQKFFRWENAAVDLFFCLSGFTLSYVYARENFRLSDYLTARIARIYPLYFVTLVIIGSTYILPLVVNDATYPAGAAVSDFLLQALMLNCWPIIGSGVHWNFQAWSISVEWLCYILLFPLLLHLKAPRSDNAKLLCVVALAALSYSLFMGCYDDRITDAALLYTAKSHWAYWVNPLRGVLGFTAGWIAFASFEKQDGLHELCTRHSPEIWLGFVAVLILCYLISVPSHMLVFLFPFVVLAATDPASVTSRLLASRFFHFLGVISYSIYMVHFIMLLVFVCWFAAPETWSAPVYLMVVAATCVVSIGTHFAIEVPARNAIRELGGRITRSHRTLVAARAWEKRHRT
jgi:peptidoglycan/LPS O-acetylase OafA/YrhL